MLRLFMPLPVEVDQPAIPQKLIKALEHVPTLVLSRHVHEKVHGGGVVGRLNTKLALAITQSVGTMWAAYVFAVIGITALVGALTNNLVLTLVVGGFSSYFLQLVLLPIIMVAQNVQQAASDARAEADHATLTAIYDLTRAVHEINMKQDEILTELQARPKA
jgi:hypothetical protein